MFGCERLQKIPRVEDFRRRANSLSLEVTVKDPRGGFDGSLGDALEAVHGPQSWCSNAFIEKGDHNAGTNCIGCHQHAGDTTGLTKIIDDEANYPSTGRTKVRQSFPADYSWAFATPDSPDQKDRFLRTVVSRIRSFEHQDGAGQ